MIVLWLVFRYFNKDGLDEESKNTMAMRTEVMAGLAKRSHDKRLQAEKDAKK